MNPILDAPVIAEQKLEYASFWIRFVAFLADSIILLIVDLVPSYTIVGPSLEIIMPNDSDSLGMMIIAYYLIMGMVNLAYFVVLESSAAQATLGKRAVGIKVGDELGQRISGANALGRSLSKLVSAMIILVGFIMAALDLRRQALHDKLAQTVVFYG